MTLFVVVHLSEGFGDLFVAHLINDLFDKTSEHIVRCLIIGIVVIEVKLNDTDLVGVANIRLWSEVVNNKRSDVSDMVHSGQT